MATDTTVSERVKYAALQESTMCGAFQVTAAERADKVAIRTKGDEFSITWGEYADKVKKVAAGLAALGLERGKTIGILLNNRPEFHFADTAAMHLGATPYSVYNTYTAEQIEYLVTDAGNTILREMKRNRLLGYNPVGLIDDDPRKKNIRLHGIRVLGTTADLPHILRTANGPVRQKECTYCNKCLVDVVDVDHGDAFESGCVVRAERGQPVVVRALTVRDERRVGHYRALLEQNDASDEAHNNLGLLYQDHGEAVLWLEYVHKLAGRRIVPHGRLPRTEPGRPAGRNQ